MKTIDARSLSREAQEQNRFLAIKLREEERMTFTKIAKIIGVARQTVHVWWKKYKAKGLQALTSKKKRKKHWPKLQIK